MNFSVVGNALHLPYPDGIAQACVTSLLTIHHISL